MSDGTIVNDLLKEIERLDQELTLVRSNRERERRINAMSNQTLRNMIDALSNIRFKNIKWVDHPHIDSWRGDIIGGYYTIMKWRDEYVLFRSWIKVGMYAPEFFTSFEEAARYAQDEFESIGQTFLHKG